MANANATETVVERELVIAASPETVWELLVDPDKTSAWMGMQSWSEPKPGEPATPTLDGPGVSS